MSEKRCPKGHGFMRRGTEEFDDDWICDRCDDIAIDRANKAREWEHYHPGEPMPESER